MTSEVRYIIENKKFKKSTQDFAPYWEFVIPIIFVALGISLLFEVQTRLSHLLGVCLLFLAFPLTVYLLRRARQLNLFDEITNERTQEGNWNKVMECLKNMNTRNQDSDFHNMTINARYSSGIPPFDEWLTIVCLDNKVLINSRPEPLTLIFWIRRNGIIELIKKLR